MHVLMAVKQWRRWRLLWLLGRRLLRLQSRLLWLPQLLWLRLWLWLLQLLWLILLWLILRRLLLWLLLLLLLRLLLWQRSLPTIIQISMLDHKACEMACSNNSNDFSSDTHPPMTTSVSLIDHIVCGTNCSSINQNVHGWCHESWNLLFIALEKS